MTAPQLVWHTEVDAPRAVVLVLHGGKSRSHRGVHAWQAAVWWMIPFARAAGEAGEGAVSVAVLRYAVRGWNGDEASPLSDTILALEQIAARYPGVPIGLLGHSMGGRVALHLAGDERIGAIAALAPWVEPDDEPRWHPGVHVLVMHGTRDRVTSARRSKAYADTLASLGADVTYVSVAGSTHSMVQHARRWREESARFLVCHLLPARCADPAASGRGADQS
jgi:dienelactone hydrolase